MTSVRSPVAESATGMFQLPPGNVGISVVVPVKVPAVWT